MERLIVFRSYTIASYSATAANKEQTLAYDIVKKSPLANKANELKFDAVNFIVE